MWENWCIFLCPQHFFYNLYTLILSTASRVSWLEGNTDMYVLPNHSPMSFCNPSARVTFFKDLPVLRHFSPVLFSNSLGGNMKYLQDKWCDWSGKLEALREAKPWQEDIISLGKWEKWSTLYSNTRVEVFAVICSLKNAGRLLNLWPTILINVAIHKQVCSSKSKGFLAHTGIPQKTF